MASHNVIDAGVARETFKKALTEAEEITAVLKSALSKIDWMMSGELVPLGDPHPLIEKAEKLSEALWDLDSESISTNETEEILRYER